MNFMNRGLKQGTDLFQTMTPAARLTTGLLLAVLVVSFASLVRRPVDGGGDYLFNAKSLSDAELAMMEAAFADAGLENGRREGNRIRVPTGETAKYLAALSDAGALPESSRTAFDHMFKNSGLMEPRPLQEQRALQASEQTIERMIRELAGVHSATVRITERDRGGLRKSKLRTAVATVKASGSNHLDRDQINTIRDIVAGTSGAEREQVTVADSNANLSYRGGGENGLPLADEDPYAARVKLYEHSTKQSIENMLTMYPGALVEVRAELGREFVNHVDRYTYDAQPVTLKQSTFTKKDTATRSSTGGQSGAASSGLGNTPQQVGSVARDDHQTEETLEQTEALPGATQTTIKKVGLVPERVTASIRIPRSLFRTIWMAENPATDGEQTVEPDKIQLGEIELRETRAIKDVVTALLPPPPPGEDPDALVAVLPYTSTPIDAPPETSLAANAGSWFASNWQTVALFGAAIFSVFFLRGMMRSNSVAAPSTAAADAREATLALHDRDHDDVDEVELASSLRGKFQHSGRSLRDELTELVHEDPDAAANVLASWIGDAA